MVRWRLSFFVVWFVSVEGFNSYGVVLPHDPYVFIGHDLSITCNLTSPLPETSESLFFTKDEIVMPEQYIKTLSSRSIQLTLPVISPEDAGQYICKLRRASGYPSTVGSQFVTVEYEPKAIKSVSCIVYNWESMTCSWDLGVNYVHLEDISVQLVWTDSTNHKQEDCPYLTVNSCTWKQENGNYSFNPDMMYYMVVIVTNKKKAIKAASRVFRIDTNKIVKPSSVSDLRTSHNSTCIHLQWGRSKDAFDRVYRIQYQPVTSEWGDSYRVQKVELENVYEKTICNLVPSTVYTVKISVKPKWDGQWSEDEATVIRLEDDVPGAAPEFQPGGFVERHCSFKGCRVINVYWRPIIRRLANGEIINYHVTARDTGTLSPVADDDTGVNTSGQLMLMADKDYLVDVQGQTKVGISPHRATILVLAVGKKPPKPLDFIVEASPKVYQNNLYQLRITWSKPKTELAILGYTLFWCRGTVSEFDCMEPMSWVILHADQMEYLKVISKKELSTLIFGISMETKQESGETVSSGIIWNECIYMQNERVLLPPKNVRISTIPQKNEIKVQWDKFKCSETRGYVSQYNIYYCRARKGQNCTRSYNVVHVSGRESNVVLTKLSKTVTYRVWVQAISGNGRGPDSKAAYTTATITTDDSLTKGKLVGIILGSFMFVVLSLIGCIILSRKCAKEVKEQLRPYDDLPNVPLPPIPMIRPNSTRSKSPDSEDDEDIYSKIANQTKSTTPPDSTSIYEPLIAESQNKPQERPGKLYVKLPDNTSPSSSIFARFYRGRHSEDSQESYEQKELTSFRPRPKRSSSKGLSHSSDMISVGVSPYSSVDVVKCPNSEKIPRRHIPNNKQCHSEGSMVDDPAYEKNNLSVLTNKVVTKPPMEPCTSREHFNIKLPNDKGKYDFHSDTLKSCVSDDTNQGNESRRHTKDSNELPEEKIASFARTAELDETDTSVFLPPDIYVQESWPKCSNNNDIKINNDVFLPDNIKETLPVPNAIVDHVDPTYRKELNIRPGPRPVSEVVQVPPHFYGSLSLLDSGDATEL